jgi:hypothetical protein
VPAEVIETATQRVFGRNGVVFTQQIGHRAGFEPVAMQSPFAAGVKQTAGGECFENTQPLRTLTDLPADETL